jgi:hypothetical protein
MVYIVSSMRPFPVFVFACLLAASLAGVARAQPAKEIGVNAGSLEIVDGTGSVALTFVRGAIYGNLDRGRITITFRRAKNPPEVVVSGQATLVRRDERTAVYEGRDIRFKVAGPGWRVIVQGSGIDVSVVGRGVVTLRGEGEMSVDSEPAVAWPEDPDPIGLGG